MSKTNNQTDETPLMGQYNRIKQKYPDAILLFRVGDFYETFGEDAIRASKVLGIVLTKRANGKAAYIELAGFPHHSVDTYLPKLVKAGYRVAICEQLENPKLTKNIVKRGVTELVTPGIAISDKILEHNANNYLASFFLNKKDQAGIAFLDISTGEFLVAEGSIPYIDKLIRSFRPSEVIFSKSNQRLFKEHFGHNFHTFAIDDWVYNYDFAEELLTKQFETKSLKGFGIEAMPLAKMAAGGILHYLTTAEHHQTEHISTIQRIQSDDFVWLDRFTLRNLELVGSSNEGGVTLIDIMDKTLTSMGGRMMRKWMTLPLKKIAAIEARNAIVETLVKEVALKQDLTEHLKQINDLERLASKVSVKKINPKEVLQIKTSLEHIQPIKALKTDDKAISKLLSGLDLCSTLKNRIETEIQADAPLLLSKGNVIAVGVAAELDELRAISTTGKDYLARMQAKEIERTGITSLKIAFNNVFGYYLEVTNTHKNRVPDDWIRKQTLVNAERYITPELKEYEQKIMGAEDKIAAIEARLYDALVDFIKTYIPQLQQNAQKIASLDCLQSFASVAIKNNYRKPILNESFDIIIEEGRHPVIEQQLPLGETYIPNSVRLTKDEEQIMIITGPNMAGKSALLRQTALIVLLAQMGSFVPAQKAEIGIVDKVFTRVGASDNISAGESTFMVEMIETATIMNNISDRSLVLLDEIGRGTSTYDGISIAWSLVEYLHHFSKFRPKTMFATHYHELNELAQKNERVRNYHVATREAGNKVIFLRKLVEGGTKHSFGIHVAQMAGMPKSIVDRANEVLKELEKKHVHADVSDRLQKMPKKDFQLSIFEAADPRWDELKATLAAIDIPTTNPVEALLKLQELKREFLD
jgi:DNA mismatch repair protein MutS